MLRDLEQQELLDLEHLRLLRIGYFVAAGVNALWALFPLIHVTMGLFILLSSVASAERGFDAPEGRVIGIVFITIGLTLSTIFAAVAVLKFLAARAIGQRRSRTFCMVVAAITCLGFPYGTLLGVFTFMVLSRPSVIARFEPASS